MSSSGTFAYPAAISAGSSSRMPSGARSFLIRSTGLRLSTSSQVGSGFAVAAVRGIEAAKTLQLDPSVQKVK